MGLSSSGQNPNVHIDGMLIVGVVCRPRFFWKFGECCENWGGLEFYLILRKIVKRGNLMGVGEKVKKNNNNLSESFIFIVIERII